MLPRSVPEQPETIAAMPIVAGPAAGGIQALSGRRVAILGFGNQGRAHAQNLRESGVSVITGTRPGGVGSQQAVRLGFDDMPIERACHEADLVVLALPDQLHGPVWKASIAPNLRPGQVAGFLHGFSVHFGQVKADAGVGVVMVAPKGPGQTLRDRFTAGQGIPALLAVHQDGTDAATTRAMAMAWAVGIGCGRAAIVETTFAAETETDLFGEQAVLCGGTLALVQGAFETLVQAGYPADLAYMECCQELKQVVDLLFERGPAGMRKAISDTAEFGAFETAERLLDDHLRQALSRLLTEVRNGAFARRFLDDARTGGQGMQARRQAASATPLERAGEHVRAWMPWLGQTGGTR
ncbi:MAG: ketol-acid reductoisomerase [Planctomycetes bacterium]|nr:ketol-acid reductoisomerase [Planctomycetota bacterium]